jgi:hydroxyethylthiazole kinase-like uncharacterized protein yjeF
MALPVISVGQMREWEEATWASGQTEAEVIRRVGQRVAEHALKLTEPGELILILAGKGHNGDDAKLAQPHLNDRVIELLEINEPHADLVKLQTFLARKPALIIDGLFGIGLNRPLSPEWVNVIDAINKADRPVLSVDVPSGLDAESGQPQGTGIHAAVTLTVGAPKRGMLKSSAWEYVGRLEVAANVGLVPCPFESEVQWSERADFNDFPPRRKVAGHKGTYGHAALVCGSRGYHGAAVLASRGAQRAQPGLITLHTTEGAYIPVAAQCQAVMVRPGGADLDLEHNYTAFLFGPGLAGADVPERWRETLRRLWAEATQPVIVDASALVWLREGTVPANAIRIVTPHPGEAARLLGTSSKDVQADRESVLKQLSTKFGGALAVLKGHQTLVGGSGTKIFVNSTGNAHMAQGGSGDLLSAFIAGLFAQRALRSDPLRTLRYAVYEHGAAADRLQRGRKNWVIEDLADELGTGLTRS